YARGRHEVRSMCNQPRSDRSRATCRTAVIRGPREIYLPDRELSLSALQAEAAAFAALESRHDEPTLYGVTDGKAVGTYLEVKFRHHLAERYVFTQGNAAKGIDLPDLLVDIKVTSEKQPQSSCPF